ncbi:hypothetical protein SPRG_14479 [Saprolegnia parasitica CBS 223.65]|uniref:Uncharacterized protein n=1 Tax=Saprolegnia parasitica (strain CBS 223.65) TaxID=695850 RepID=A0A067BPR6_SAPPC|nr:hypothetical protein SPRG_14479 [Saprolegnia parasitica CBS 223.65]KDO20233.1 hypothetical protein SPRG_14479 [Saprolegnia parasitica CBS 223.65]|eukprot:XP_012209046.1 hypothetical protein SPRG_14479 [Saprolegnia parasitica CBS 223.65]
MDAAPIPSIFAYLRAHKTASPAYESPVGDMLLHVCCARGSVSDVRAALPLCPWFLPNRFGLTGAMIAAQKGRLDVLNELVAAGADLNQPDFLGRDCFYHLHTHGHDALAAVLGAQKAHTRQWWAPPPTTVSLPPSSPLRPVRVPSPSKPRCAPRSLCNSCQLLFARKLCTTCQCCYCDKCYGRVHFQAANRHHTYIEMAPTNAPEDHEASWNDHLATCHSIYESVLKLQGATSRAVAALVSPKRVRQVELATIDAVVANQSNRKLHTAQLQLASVYRREGKLEEAKQQLETLLKSLCTDVDDDVAFLGHVYLEHARARNETGAAIQRFDQALALLWTHVAMDDSHLCAGLDDYHHFLIAQSDYAASVGLAHQTLQRRLGRLPASHALVHQARDQLADVIGARERAAMRLEDKAASSRDRFMLVLRSDQGFRAFCARQGKDAHVDLWRAIDALDPTERRRAVGYALYSQFLQTKKVLCLPSKVQLQLLARLDHSVVAADGSRKDKPLVRVFAKTKRILFEYLYTTAYCAYTATTTRPTTP